MRRLYGVLGAMLAAFSASMALFAASAYEGLWILAVFGALAGLVFVALGPLLSPARRKVPFPDKRQATWLLQFFGATITTELLTAALLAWIMGNRTLSHTSGYEVLGLLIFLGLLGAGAQGMLATLIFFVGAHAQRQQDKRAHRAALPAG